MAIVDNTTNILDVSMRDSDEEMEGTEGLNVSEVPGQQQSSSLYSFYFENPLEVSGGTSEREAPKRIVAFSSRC